MNRIAHIAAIALSFAAAGSALAAGQVSADGGFDATAGLKIQSTKAFGAGDVHTGRLDHAEPDFRLVATPAGTLSRAEVRAELNAARDAGLLAQTGGDPSYDAPAPAKRAEAATRVVAQAR